MHVPVIRSISSLVGAALVVVVLALYAHHVATKFGSFTVDDAAISYAYAHNLAHGDGFRLTANASPVEGFSNPLQVLLLVPFAWIGANLDKPLAHRLTRFRFKRLRAHYYIFSYARRGRPTTESLSIQKRTV